MVATRWRRRPSQTPRFEGALTLYVDPSTSAPRAEPMELPLSIERHIEALDDESGASRVVIKETITQQAGELLSAVEENVYVMDRRSMKNLADQRAYAFRAENPVDRSGEYRLALPLDTDPDATYEMYKSEIAGTYQLVPNTENPTTETEGLTLANFTASAEAVPLSEAYLAALRTKLALPAETTLAAQGPRLKAAGIDLDTLLPPLLAALSAQDRAAVQAALSAPVTLRYLTTFSGDGGVDRRTGTEVDIRQIDENISVEPHAEGLSVVSPILARYSSAPAVQAVLPALTVIAGAPATSLVSFSYSETDASVAEIAPAAKDMGSRILLAERWVPLGFLGVGVVALLAGLAARCGSGSCSAAGSRRRRRPVPPTPSACAGRREKVAEA